MTKKKSRFFIIIGVLLVVAFVFLLVFNKTVIGILDRFFILEQNRKTYWNYFVEARKAAGKIVGETEYVLSEDRNYIITGTDEYEGNGYSISINIDGTITYKGTNNNEYPDTYIFCTGGRLLFPKGSYFYSDGLAETDNIYSRIIGVNYEPGAGAVSNVLVSSNITSGSFEIMDEYDSYYCEIVILPGFSSTETTLYPMVVNESSKDCSFKAGIITDNSIEEKEDVNYSIVEIRKDIINQIKDRDFLRYIRETGVTYPNSDSISFRFEDNTGIIYPFDEKEQIVYGRMNGVGRITDPICEIDRNTYFWKQITQIAGQTDIREIVTLDSYLTALKDSDYTVFASVCDEATHSLTKSDEEALGELGLSENLKDKYMYSYLFVVDDGKVIDEQCSLSAVKSEGTLDSGDCFLVESSGFEAGSRSSIILNDIEYSMNLRGINIVVFDKSINQVIDSVSFDTYSGNRACR